MNVTHEPAYGDTETKLMARAMALGGRVMFRPALVMMHAGAARGHIITAMANVLATLDVPDYDPDLYWYSQ